MRIEFLSSFSATSAQSLPRYLPGTHQRGGRLSEILQIDGKDGDGTRGKGASHRPLFFWREQKLNPVPSYRRDWLKFKMYTTFIFNFFGLISSLEWIFTLPRSLIVLDCLELWTLDSDSSSSLHRLSFCPYFIFLPSFTSLCNHESFSFVPTLHQLFPLFFSPHLGPKT